MNSLTEILQLIELDSNLTLTNYLIFFFTFIGLI